MFAIDFNDLLTALALFFVIEGLIPFVNPDAIRKVYLRVAQMNDQTIRFLGISSTVIGILLLYVVR